MISLKSLGSFLKPLTGPSRIPLCFSSHVRSDLGEKFAFDPVNKKMKINNANEIGIVNE